jgi:hypothetical protein
MQGKIILLVFLMGNCAVFGIQQSCFFLTLPGEVDGARPE